MKHRHERVLAHPALFLLIFPQMIIFYLHTDLTDLTDFAPSELVRYGESAVDYDLV